MWEPDYDKHAKYWLEKDAVSNKNGKTIEYLRKKRKRKLMIKKSEACNQSQHLQWGNGGWFYKSYNWQF